MNQCTNPVWNAWLRGFLDCRKPAVHAGFCRECLSEQISRYRKAMNAQAIQSAIYEEWVAALEGRQFMLTTSYVSTLCEESHRIASEHGWLDRPRGYGTIIGLFHSELSEALEEFRAGRKFNEIYLQAWKNGHHTSDVRLDEREVIDSLIADGFRLKPCGIAIELADFIIRVAEAVETLGFTGRFAQFVATASADGDDNFPDAFIPQCHSIVSRAYSWSPKAMSSSSVLELASAFMLVFGYCSRNGIPLEQAIEMKTAYNEKREYRHGGKLV